MKSHNCLAWTRKLHSYMLITIFNFGTTRSFFQTKAGVKFKSNKRNLIVFCIKTVITFSSWVFSHTYDEFCGNLRNHKHIYLFQNWNLDGKNVDFIKSKRKQKCKLWKIYEFSMSSLWKASTFDFFTAMVVILLVYMRLIL